MYYETAIGGGTSAPAIYNDEIRLYQNSSGTGGGTITISAVEGLELVSVEIGSSMATSIAYTLNGSTDKSETESLAADGTFLVSDINAQSVTFYCMGTESSSRLYVNYLKATYKSIVSTQVIKPVLSPEDGTTFTESLTVTASCATAGAIIYYTTNGDIPTTESNVFPANGLPITETTTIKAMAAMAPELTAEDFMKLPRFEVYASLQAGGRATGWIRGKTLPQEQAIRMPAELKAASQKRFGKPAAEVEQEYLSVVSSASAAPPEAPDAPIGRRKRC